MVVLGLAIRLALKLSSGDDEQGDPTRYQKVECPGQFVINLGIPASE